MRWPPNNCSGNVQKYVLCQKWRPLPFCYFLSMNITCVESRLWPLPRLRLLLNNPSAAAATATVTATAGASAIFCTMAPV